VSEVDIEALYSQPLAADRSGALYNAFSYPTKISAESIAVFIACHTEPGDHVLDVFGGSGTTGIAALLCERPTDRMRSLADARGLSPVWGKRRATVYELSEIGTLVGRVMTTAPEPRAFVAAAKRLLAEAEALEPDLYRAESPDGDPGEVRHVIWSDVVACPQCGIETTYAGVRVRYDPLRFDESNKCACGFAGEPDDWRRLVETVVDPFTGMSNVRRRRVPWKVYGRSNGRNWTRSALPADSQAEAMSVSRPLPPGAPLASIQWGDLHRTGYHQGMTHLHHLYTARNFRALAVLWALIDEQPQPLREALRLLILSYNAAHSTLMTRVVLKKNSKDFIVTGAQSGVLYVSGLPVEKNVFVGVRRKIAVFEKAFELLHGLGDCVNVVTGSSAHLHLDDDSIDYVFTDPPFGGYIPYAEINQINELWLGKTTDKAEEAIISPAQGKDVDAYQALLTSVFTEVSRVMTPEADATLIFHSSQASVWRALAESLRDSGLVVMAASILDKTQSSFKQVNGHVAVSGDPLLRVKKRTSELVREATTATMRDLVAISNASALMASPSGVREQQHLFSQLVGRALIDDVPITLDARLVYELQGLT